ncbi:MAG: hypothetical protein ABH870_01130 [bacterium]
MKFVKMSEVETKLATKADLVDGKIPTDQIPSSLGGNTFETISKNIENHPYVVTYGSNGLEAIIYNFGGGLSITKTFNYTEGVLMSIVLSGDTPPGITLTKTLNYTNGNLTGVTYS